MNAVPKNKRVSLVMLKKWKELGPIDIKKVLDYGLVANPFITKYDADNFKQKLMTNDFTYYGMMKEIPKAHGLGRAQGQWGIYEGNFENGKPHGYGRVIYNDTTTFEGLFNNSVPYHSLSLKYLCDSQNNTSPGQPTGKQCYSIKKQTVSQTYLPLLAIERIQSKSETDLI